MEIQILISSLMMNLSYGTTPSLEYLEAVMNSDDEALYTTFSLPFEYKWSE